MNKSRRTAAIQARHFAEVGFSVLQMDLYGCGDSAGDFGRATWSQWLRDLEAANEWIDKNTQGPKYLWGLRLGANIAIDLAKRLPARYAGLFLWQPITNCETYLTQFLRLQLANQMISGAKGQATTEQLKARLLAGEHLEIAGYTLHAELAKSINENKLASNLLPIVPIYWWEVLGSGQVSSSPATQRVVEAWRNQGARLIDRQIIGEQFWATQEIADCPELIDATTSMARML